MRHEAEAEAIVAVACLRVSRRACRIAPMHEEHFPKSTEPSGRLADRFVAALEYEERAGLGFRRAGDDPGTTLPYLRREGDVVFDSHMSGGQILAGYMAAASLVLGACALVYKPLVLGTIALVMGVG